MLGIIHWSAIHLHEGIILMISCSLHA